MRLLSFLFNTARNISLIIVLSSLAVLAYFNSTGELQQACAKMMEKCVEQSSNDSMSIDEEENGDYMIATIEKIGLQSPSRTLFIRPEKIAYFENVKGSVSAKLIDGTSIDDFKSTFKEIKSTLEKLPDNPFFFTRDYIINCKYVTGYYSANMSGSGSYYQFFAVVETGDELRIPKDKYKDFMEQMKSYAIGIE